MDYPLYSVVRHGTEIVVELLSGEIVKSPNVDVIIVSCDGVPEDVARRAAIDHFARNPERARVLVSTVTSDLAW